MTTATSEGAIHFVGVDPSLTATGLAILDESGKIELHTIRTTPHSHKTKYHRVRYIATTVREKIAALGKVVVCLEGPYIDPKNMATARAMIELHTMIHHLLYWGDIHFREIPPVNLKQFVANKAFAKKELIIKKVFQIWKIDTDDNNQADAAGLAYMAKAMEAVKGNGDLAAWPKYQLQVVENIMKKG